MSAAALLPFLAALAAAYDPCGARLRGLDRAEGAPGQEFVMYGSWGGSQGKKLPVINRGGQNLLEVVEWGPERLRVRVPASLPPGKYRVGVYCNPLSEGGAYGSGFADFEVTDEVGGTVRPQADERPLIDPADRARERTRPAQREAPQAAPLLDERKLACLGAALLLPLLWLVRRRLNPRE